MATHIGWKAALTAALGALGTAATKDVGTTPGTIKAGDWKPAAADVTDSTAAGQALLTAPDAAAQRSALGLGTVSATFDIRDYGAKVDGIVLTDAAITAATATLTSPTYSFTAADVGKVVGIAGAGNISADYTVSANDGVLVSSIVSVTGGAATLADVAVNTVAGTTATFGTADDAAYYEAQLAASAAHGTVYIPPGRSVVTQPLDILDFVTWAGAGRDTSWVEVIASGGASGPFPWLYKSSPEHWTEGVSLRDFAVEARFFVRDGYPYVPSLKPLNFWWMRRPLVERLQCRNFPATVLPFDGCTDGTVIRDNLIVNPGRLCPPSAPFGGSGIGIGINRYNNEVNDYLIEGNAIIGTGSTTQRGRGNNGIFVEAQYSPGINHATSPGVRIIGNFVRGMPCGITDLGAGHMIISKNTILDCYDGVKIGGGGVGGAFAGEGTLVEGNVIRGWSPGPDISAGVRLIMEDSMDWGDARIIDNTITGRTGWGILVYAPDNRSVMANNVEIRGNRIKSITRTGIRFGLSGAIGKCMKAIVVGNDVYEVGTADLASDDSGIRFELEVDHLTLTGNVVRAPMGSGLVFIQPVNAGQIAGNDVGTFGGAGVIAAAVRVFGNLGWAASIPAVTGSRGGNAALASLLTQLASLKIVTDGTSA